MPNLFLHYVRMKHRITNAWERNSVPAFNDTMLFDFIGRAYAEIQTKLRIGDSILEGNVTQGTDFYSVPVASAGIRNPQFGAYLRVMLKPPSGTGTPIQLIQKPFEWMAARFDMTNASQVTGYPRFWCWTPTAPLGRIQVRPTPNFTRSSGMQFIFTPQPNESFAVYNQSAITAEFTNGDTAVTFSADPNASAQNVVAGYEIGVPAATQQDGSPSYDDTPRNWVPLEDVSGLNATLAWNWPGATGTGQRFIAAQVPNIDRLLPGSFDSLPSDLSAVLYMAGMDPEKVPGLAALSEMAYAKLDALDTDTAGQNVGSMSKPWARIPNSASGMNVIRVGNGFYYG